MTNATAFICYHDYLASQGDFSGVSNCDCTTGCNEPDYVLDISTAIWPANVTNFRTPMCLEKFPNTDIDCYTAYSENAVFIDVNFNSLVYKTTTEYPNKSVRFNF